MDPERIVRNLAARPAPQCDSIPPTDCRLCGAEAQGHDHWLPDDPAAHAPDCPWRLAREWVAANPG